jgi:cytosine permease
VSIDQLPVSPSRLQAGRKFAASYAGEHVAGTEFVIGALFVAWGISTSDIIFGLLLGNLFAVLTWALITTPIAVDTRLTLYSYLEKIAGTGTVKIYNVVNGVLFAVLGGAMITVSASAVRIIFGIEAQVNWYPSDWRFVIVAIAIGLIVSYVAAKGFASVARFSEVCAPWLILMFLAGGIVTLPLLVDASHSVTALESPRDFLILAEELIWIDNGSDIGFWHVAAFAWIANMATHGALGDMSLLRFARKRVYGFYPALGMFLGHYMAWICAGIMGAGVALTLDLSIEQLDPGEVASRTLGVAGILAVIIAGWTTSNPTIYRAGLAFQALNHRWKRKNVTLVVGVATTIVACFPFVFTRLLEFVGIMGLMLSPVGAIIVTEHWIFPRIGMTRYWSSYRKNYVNVAAVASWLSALGFAFLLERTGVLHLFFLVPPVWLFTTILYSALAFGLGARDYYPEAAIAEQRELERKAAESNYLASTRLVDSTNHGVLGALSGRILLALAGCSLVACLLLAFYSFEHGQARLFRDWLLLPTGLYFFVAVLWVQLSDRVQPR